MTRGLLVHDVHSRLNPTGVREIVPAATPYALVEAVRAARRQGRAACVGGGCHAMGGQAFAEGGVLIDTPGLDRIGGLDPVSSTVEVEAGIQWQRPGPGRPRRAAGAHPIGHNVTDPLPGLTLARMSERPKRSRATSTRIPP